MVEGGAERADSVEAALARVKPEADFVCVHDAARPCLADDWIDKVFEAAERTGAAIFAVPVAGTLKRVGADQHDRGDRRPRQGCGRPKRPRSSAASCCWTPTPSASGFQATDDAQLVERLGQPVTVVPGSPINLKITTKEDLRLAEQALKALPKPKLQRPAASVCRRRHVAVKQRAVGRAVRSCKRHPTHH